jgi:multidrug resistance efflux pump
MKGKRIVPIAIGAAVVAMVAMGIYVLRNPDACTRALGRAAMAQSELGGLAASGFIEAEEIAIAPELGGRVVGLFAGEGEDVEAGQVLVRLDGSLLEAQTEVAQAAVEVAEASLTQARAGVRPEQIRQAEAALAQAQVARDGARQAWQDAIAIRDNPQDLEAQIALARAQVAAAKAGLARTIALKDATEIAHENYWDAREALDEAKQQLKKIPKAQRPKLPGLQLDFHLIPNAYWKSWVGVNTAQAALDGARAALQDLYAMRDNPQEMNARVDEIETQFHAAEAAVQMAQAHLEALQAGATVEELDAAEAQVAQARASLDSLLVLQDKLIITAPVGGLVLESSIHEGELAVPGATMLTLGDLDEVTLTVYVPEDQLGQVRLGQSVDVRVDTFPDRAFEGQVVAIAHGAEFTPRNVQTQEERVNMVFAVDVSIPNPEHLLKPGVPADAVIITQES